MKFAQARDSEYPPYLLAFAGSPAERHVENLKVRRCANVLFMSHFKLITRVDTQRGWILYIHPSCDLKYGTR